MLGRRDYSVILTIMLLSYSLHSSGQENSGKHVSWPPFHKSDFKNLSISIPDIQKQKTKLFTDNLFLDTTTFTPISTNLPGVIAGDATWIDYDNDGDLDVLVSGYADSGFITKIYHNDHGIFTDIQASIVQLETEGGVAWGDYDNDGDYDLAITGSTDTTGLHPISKIYNNDNGIFVDINAPLMPLHGGAVTWADYDNDGDLDLLIAGSSDNGSTFSTKIYKNNNGNFIDSKIALPGVWGASIAWGDYDNDGDLDLLLTGYGDLGVTTKLFQCDIHSDTIVTYTDTHAPLVKVNSSSVAWGDYNNDGYLDIALSGISSGGPITKIYRNDSGKAFTDIQTSIKPMAVSALAWGDYDNDGDLDLVESGAEDFWYGTNPTTKIYRNDNGIFTDIDAALTGTWFGSITWGDYDNDGKLDLLMTGGTVSRPGIWYRGPFYQVTKIYHNNIPIQNTPPSAPTALVAYVDSSSVRFNWNTATDDKTPNQTLTYNIRLGTSPNSNTIISPNADVITGHRRIPKVGNAGYRLTRKCGKLPPGKYYWSVQAIDNGYAGSTFATEQSFTMPSTNILDNNRYPAEFGLDQNYPNPFNPSTSIRFSIKKETHINLKIFNILGQEIVTLINENKPSGVYELIWDANNYPSGVYLYRLIAGEFSEIKKMILVK